MLPIPCPTSSLFELCSWRVRLSATTEVSNASIQPSTTEHDGVDQDDLPLVDIEYGQPELRQPGRYLANPAYFIQVEQHQGGQGDDDQRGQLRRYVTGQPDRHQEQDSERGSGQQCFPRLNAGHQFRQVLQDTDDPAGRHGLAQGGGKLQDDQDDTDAGHETRHDVVGHHSDVLAETQHAQQDLEQSGEDHDRKGHGHAVDGIGGDQLGNDCSKYHCHRAGRFRHQTGRAPEQGGKQADKNCTVKTGLGAGTRGNAKGKRHRQGNDGSGNTAENITANIAQIYFIEQLHYVFFIRQQATAECLFTFLFYHCFLFTTHRFLFRFAQELFHSGP